NGTAAGNLACTVGRPGLGARSVEEVRLRNRNLPFLALALAWAGPALAQGGGASSTGSINGTVTDSSSSAVPGVTVPPSTPSIPGVQTATTNTQGQSRFPSVPAGEYKLVYELTGFSTVAREGIRVTLGFNATVNAQLSVQSMQEQVTVTGESPTIDTTTTRVQ